MMKKIFLAIILFVGVAFSIAAQHRDFESFRRERERDMQEFAARRDSAMMRYNERFREFVDQRNREYAEYLKNDWERFQLFKSGEPFEEPKPEVIPLFDPQEDIRGEVNIEKLVPVEARLAPREVFREPVQLKPLEKIDHTRQIQVNYYGRSISIPVDRSFWGLQARGIEENDVAGWFSRAGETNYIPTLVAVLEIAGEMNMNDWALYMLVKKLGAELSRNNHNTNVLYSWFLLQQAGYDIRVGRQDDLLLPLMPFNDMVYNIPLTQIGQKQFAVIEGNPEKQLFTYRQAMSGAYRGFDLSFTHSPKFAEQANTKAISFSYNGKAISFELEYDPVLVAMLQNQPQSDANVYFDSDASVSLVRSGDRNLRSLLTNKSYHDKVSFLLRMTQTAFEYQTDIEQFGFQKFMFPDEVIHYAASDCDDRTALFAWLVRNYAGKQVAAVQYNDHIATAVHFASGNPSGDFFTLDGKHFVIADPTYVNAPIGKTMPKYVGKSPKVWLIDTDRFHYERTMAAWEQLFEYGGRRGNNQNDIAFLPDGRFVATGYFNESFGDGQIQLRGAPNKRTAFIAAFDHDMRLTWAETLDSEHDATGFALQIDQRNNILMSGSFAGRLQAADITIASNGNEADVFVASYSLNGKLLWLHNPGLEREHQNNSMTYVCLYDLDGNLIEKNYYNDPRETDFGLFVHNENAFVLKGTFAGTSGLTMHDAPELASFDRMDYTEILIDTHHQMINNDIESSIAGLFAAIHLVKTEGVVFPGTAAQEAIQKENPEFRKRFPITFANIGKISFLMNQSGLIEIRTENGEDVLFEQLRIKDRSVIRIISLPNNDEKIEVISRITVGQYVIWYPLNYVQLFHQTGDLLFDYRRNNSQVIMNLRKDILN